MSQYDMKSFVFPFYLSPLVNCRITFFNIKVCFFKHTKYNFLFVLYLIQKRKEN